MSSRIIKGDGLTLDAVTLPADPTDGQIVLDVADGEYKRWRESLGVWDGLGGGGGGGGGLQWNPISGEAPQDIEEYGEKVYLFEDAITQTLAVYLKVPSSYVAGSPISMKLGIYSPSTSGTVLMTATAYLIKEGVTAVNSTTDSHVSTNTAITNTVADQYRQVTLDLTDSAGEVNSVAVEPSDMLRVNLFRGSGTDTADIRFIPSSTEATFR